MFSPKTSVLPSRGMVESDMVCPLSFPFMACQPVIDPAKKSLRAVHGAPRGHNKTPHHHRCGAKTRTKKGLKLTFSFQTTILKSELSSVTRFSLTISTDCLRDHPVTLRAGHWRRHPCDALRFPAFFRSHQTRVIPLECARILQRRRVFFIITAHLQCIQQKQLDCVPRYQSFLTLVYLRV